MVKLLFPFHFNSLHFTQLHSTSHHTMTTPETPNTPQEVTNIYSLPLERLRDILALCSCQWGLLRNVDTTFKNITDDIPVKESEKSQNPKTKTEKYLFLSSLESYKYISTQTTLTSQTLINAIRHKTFSVEVAQILFQTSLMTRKVLFTLGETSSVELLTELAKNWPFFCYLRKKRTAKWKKFVVHCLTSYSNDVLDWLKQNQDLFFDNDKKLQDPQNIESTSFQKRVKSLIKELRYPFHHYCNDPDRLIQISKDFEFYQTHDIIGKMSNVQELDKVLTQGTFKCCNYHDFNLTVLLQHFVDKEGRLTFVKNWDELNDQDKLEHLEQFKNDVHQLVKRFKSDVIKLDENTLKYILARLFDFVYFETNWVPGLKWSMQNHRLDSYWRARFKISREMLDYCISSEMTMRIRARSFINRIIMTGDIKMFEEYVINISIFHHDWSIRCIKFALLEKNQHIFEWILEKHFEFFCTMFPNEDIESFKRTYGLARSTFKSNKQKFYKAILYWLIIKVFSYCDTSPSLLICIGNKIAKGKFGDPVENSEVHKFLIDSYGNSNTGMHRPFCIKNIKSLEHFKVALPLFLPHFKDLDFQHVFDSLENVKECEQFLDLLRNDEPLEIFDFTGLCWEMRENKSDQIDYLLLLRRKIKNMNVPVHCVIKALIKWNRLEDLLSTFFIFPIRDQTLQDQITEEIVNYGTKAHMRSFRRLMCEDRKRKLNDCVKKSSNKLNCKR